MPSLNNRVVIAAAGSGKTQSIIDEALAAPTQQRILITTYTNENLAQIVQRIEQRTGILPPNIKVMPWFTFLINECARPYQRALLGEPNVIQGLNFHGSRNRYTRQQQTRAYYLDDGARLYRDGVADFVCKLNAATEGKVMQRLAGMFDHVYVDELQDMNGYDLDVIELLFKAPFGVTAVGDPRQHILRTNNSRRRRQEQGTGLLSWLAERRNFCDVEFMAESSRCNQAICDWADALYPDMEKTTSRNLEVTGHDGIFMITLDEVHDYVAQYNPVVLRYQRTSDTLGLPATNIGVAKGSTYDRVLIFPTRPWLAGIGTQNLSTVTSKERLYVAVTRARFSVAFVVPEASLGRRCKALGDAQ